MNMDDGDELMAICGGPKQTNEHQRRRALKRRDFRRRHKIPRNK